MEAGAQETIVVIDDDYAIRLSCRQTLSKTGYRVETFEDGAQGLEGVARLRPDLVVIDLKMPGISGMEVIPRVREIDPHVVVVVITGYATIGTAVDAMKAGAYDFLPKPFKPDELRLIVKRGLERRRLLKETQHAEVERELLKRRFVTFVSHQLKSPLAAIHQYLDVMRSLSDSEEDHRKRSVWLERCLCRSQEMQRLIEDWLTLSAAEVGKLSRQRVKVDLRRTVDTILETYDGMASEKEVTLSSDFPDEPCAVWGDPNCLGVLFDNLIVNAIQYNRKGGAVTVTAEMTEGEIAVAVRDTGVGVPEEYRSMVFDEFFRVKDDRKKGVGGTGLGLPICRRIVAELGGIIEVESEVDRGSTFRVRLPVLREPAEALERKEGEA